MGNCLKVEPTSSLRAIETKGLLGIAAELKSSSKTTLTGDEEVCVLDAAEGISPRAIRSASPFKTLTALSQSQGESKLWTCLHNQLGAIHFNCLSLDETSCEAERVGKPILFVDIDGITSTSKFVEVCSHPLAIEAAESLFFTVLRQPESSKENGALRATVRVLDKYGNDVVAEIGGKYLSVERLVSLMICGLKALRIEIPTYLLLLEQEEKGKVRCLSDVTVQVVCRQIVFGVSESKVGEVEFGGHDGVLATRTGYLGRQQVVQVTYDSTKVSYGSLARLALHKKLVGVIYYAHNDERIAAHIEVKRMEGATDVVQLSGTILKDLDSKHFLRKTVLRYVPLTDLQATMANRFVAMGAFNEATHLLSPRQGVMMMKTMNSAQGRVLNEAVDVPIEQAWTTVA